MSIRIKSRGGESTDQMMRRFKKLCEKEGLIKDIKRKEFFEKPSERNRRDMRKAISKRIREALPPSVREKMREEKKKKFGGGRGGFGGGGGGGGGGYGGGDN